MNVISGKVSVMGSHMNISSIGVQWAVTVEGCASVGEAVHIVDDIRCDGVLVLPEVGPPGVVGYWDLHELVKYDRAVRTHPVGEYSTECRFRTYMYSDALKTLMRMRGHALEMAPVWRRGIVVGTISRRAIAAALRIDLRDRVRNKSIGPVSMDPVFGKIGRRRAA